MRLEFLVLFSITQYGGIVRQYKNVSGVHPANYSRPENPVYYQKPFLEASIPMVSSPDYQNELAVAVYGCSNGTVSIFLNSTSIHSSLNNITQRFYNVWVYEDGFTPSIGLNKAHLTYEILCDGSSYNGIRNRPLYTLNQVPSPSIQRIYQKETKA